MPDITLTTLWNHYNLLASLASVALIAGISIVGKKIAFRNPDLEQMRVINRTRDKEKLGKEKYPPMVRASRESTTPRKVS